MLDLMLDLIMIGNSAARKSCDRPRTLALD
jgi:hypothetical protein